MSLEVYVFPTLDDMIDAREDLLKKWPLARVEEIKKDGHYALEIEWQPEPQGPLPKTAEARKAVPIATGVIDYFPDALAAIAEVSRQGNIQHGLGDGITKPLVWDRSKSTDEADALIRHFLERGTLDSDGLRHSAKMAWRALAYLQKEIERERTASSHPGAADA